MAAWAVFLIVFGCIGAVALAGYAAYRLRIRNAMHQEIRSIMAQYMPLGKYFLFWTNHIYHHATCNCSLHMVVSAVYMLPLSPSGMLPSRALCWRLGSFCYLQLRPSCSALQCLVLYT